MLPYVQPKAPLKECAVKGERMNCWTHISPGDAALNDTDAVHLSFLGTRRQH